MPIIDLPADELAAVTAAIRRAIEDDRYPHAPRLDPFARARRLSKAIRVKRGRGVTCPSRHGIAVSPTLHPTHEAARPTLRPLEE
jgi:hypothetical protein